MRGRGREARNHARLGLADDGGITTTTAAARTLEILRKTNSPWAGINLDIGNFRTDAYAQIEMCAPDATKAHFTAEMHVNGQAQPTDFGRVL